MKIAKNDQSWHMRLIFSSPEPKAQLSPSDHTPSVVRLSIYLSVNFLPFQHPLKNHKANFNQTRHKAPLGKQGFKVVKISMVNYM